MHNGNSGSSTIGELISAMSPSLEMLVGIVQASLAACSGMRTIYCAVNSPEPRKMNVSDIHISSDLILGR